MLRPVPFVTSLSVYHRLRGVLPDHPAWNNAPHTCLSLPVRRVWFTGCLPHRFVSFLRAGFCPSESSGVLQGTEWRCSLPFPPPLLQLGADCSGVNPLLSQLTSRLILWFLRCVWGICLTLHYLLQATPATSLNISTSSTPSSFLCSWVNFQDHILLP